MCMPATRLQTALLHLSCETDSPILVPLFNLQETSLDWSEVEEALVVVREKKTLSPSPSMLKTKGTEGWTVLGCDCLYTENVRTWLSIFMTRLLRTYFQTV
jgi:hypothetical protein